MRFRLNPIALRLSLYNTAHYNGEINPMHRARRGGEAKIAALIGLAQRLRLENAKFCAAGTPLFFD